MSTETVLRISTRWSPDEISTALGALFHIDTTIKTSNNPSLYSIMLYGKVVGERCSRTIRVHLNSETPLGPAISLRLGHDELAVKILRGLGEVLGGFLQEKDSVQSHEMLYGMLSVNDGLPYFVKYHVLYGGDPKDPEKLLETIKKWKEQYGK